MKRYGAGEIGGGPPKRAYKPSCAAGKPKVLGQAIEGLLSDEQRPGTPATFTFEQFMQIMALACETPAKANREVEYLDAARIGR